jgi:AcrR family transcriptional regulator
MPKVSPQHAQAQKKIILQAAVRCFAEQGFHPTTMRDVLRESGMSAGALYLYFKSKEDLIEAIAENRHLHERRWITEALEQTDLAAGMRLLLTLFGKALADRAARLERRLSVQLWAEALRDEKVRRHILAGVHMPADLLTRLFQAARKRGEFPRSLDPRAAARILIALFQGMVLQIAWEPGVPVDRCLKVVDSMLLALTQQAVQGER